MRLGTAHVLHERDQPPRELLFASLGQPRPRAGQRLLEALAAKRLEQVVEGVHVEGAQRVLVVRRHEDRERHGVAHFGDDAKAVEVRDLQVEEHQVGAQAANGLHGVQARVGSADHLDVGFRLQQLDQPIACDRLVLDDQSANPRHATPSTRGW